MASNGEEPVDLYAGLALPPPKKRTAEAVNASTSFDTSKSPATATGGSSSDPQPTKKQKTSTATGRIDVASAIERLKTHIVVDKKFPKAADLFRKLLVEKLSSDTRTIFLDALTELIAAKGTSWSGKKEFTELVQALLDKQDVFLEDERTNFADWQLLAVTHRDLFTDDTFQFARAAKQIKQRLDAAVEADSEPRTAQLQLLMPLLRTLFSRHGVAWAKVSAESVLGVCTRHRLLFAETERSEVDQWTKTVQERRHASGVSRNAAADVRRNIVELTSENASQAKPKVGRSNHPLFNRDQF